MALPGFASRFQCFSQLQNPAQVIEFSHSHTLCRG
jgi:hypothetical protein